MSRLEGIVAALREHCPWTRVQDHTSLLGYLIEEAYETVEAVEQGLPADELRGELADVLFQVVLHARISEENGDFGLHEVIAELSRKLIRRSPHVFAADGTVRVDAGAQLAQIDAEWQRAKKEENPSRGKFDGIPAALPALSLAQKTLRRAGAPGAEGPEEAPGTESLDSTSSGSAQVDAAQVDAEQLGDQLLGLLRQAPGVDAEQALRAAVLRLQAGILETDGASPR